jgi:hypothetical protein
MSFGMNSSQNSLLGASGRTGNVIPSGYSRGSLQNFSPEQMQLFQQMFSHVAPDSYLSKLAGGDQSQFEQMEAPALRQFSGQLGNIASRFSGMGMGGRRSSGFQNTATAAASNFSQDLQSRRQQLQRQAILDLMGISSDLLSQRPQDQFLVPDQPKKRRSGFFSSLGSGLGGAIPGAISGFLTAGPPGAAAGALTGAAGAFLGTRSQ